MSIIPKKSITLDVVVIGRNEAEQLESSLNSAIEASKYFQKTGYPYPKIVYIDGQSSDKSVKIAENLGIKVLIVSGMPTPAKGRHLGFTIGESIYVFFLDGDTIVDKKWLVKGVEYLEKYSKTAGVGGILDWEGWRNGKIVYRKANYRNTYYDGQNVVDGVGGTFLYRRDILNRIGDFNPELPISEELELRLRIDQAGYKLVRIAIPMATHRDTKTSITTFLQKKIFTKNIFIPGVITRQAPKSQSILKLLFFKYWVYLFHPLIILYILLSILFYIHTLSKIWIILGIILAIVLFIAHYFYKGKNFRRAIFSVITMNFFSFGWIIGLLLNRPKVCRFYKV